jgi:asparagine synthase (glutamine-hydrolysing)
MCDAIRHRGPDDAGYYTSDQVAIGMRRLSIIDVAGGHQPIANEDGSVQLVFNGEIYNFQDLRARLARGGHRLATQSDSETIVHLYEDLGSQLVHELRGMFAFAIWDERRRQLLLARDRLGIKPLYYWPTSDGVAFASELRALLTLPGFPRSFDQNAVIDYLAFGYIPDPRCIFAGVHKLPPGHVAQWSESAGLQVTRYWSPTRDEIPAISDGEAIEETQRLLRESVKLHMVSDVPLGAFLSGGVDSSAVVAAMASLSTEPVRTFSIGFQEPDFDESENAARVATALGTRHTQLIVRPDADTLFEDLARSLDEPFADPSSLPTFLVSHLARRDVTVALSGDGGDELFGGYTRYQELETAPRLPPLIRRAATALGHALPHSAYGRNRLLALGRSRRGRYAVTVALPGSQAEGGVLRPEIASAGPEFDHALDVWFDSAKSRDFTTQLMMVDVMSYLPGDILTKVDRASMAHSLEARVPLLDHRLVEFALALPASLKIRGGTSKWVFRKAIAGLVPPRVLEGPKRGFDVPLRDWLRGPLSYRLSALLHEPSVLFDYADPSAVRRLVTEHQTGRRDHARAIWRFLMFDRWARLLASGELEHPVGVSREVDALLERAVADGTFAQSP